MLALIRAEWLKLSRRPLAWLLLGIFLLLFVVQIAASVAFVSILGSSGELPQQFAQYELSSHFPGILGAALGHVNGLGGFFAIIFAGAAMGSEYSWGTLRTQLARQPNRIRYLLAKILTLLALLLVAILATLLLAALLGLALGLWRGPMGSVSMRQIASLPLAILRALLVLLPYMLLTLWATVASRSALIGTAAGIFYLMMEGGFGALAIFANLGGLWRMIYNMTMGQNVNALVLENSHLFGLKPELITPALAQSALPHPLIAACVLLLYSASFLAAALWLFRRRDVLGAG